MAIAGDLVIRLAADFAEFAKGMEEANGKLDGFGKMAEDVGAKFEAFSNKIKGLATVAGISAAIGTAANKLLEYAKASEAASLKVADLSSKLGLSTDEVQALQYASLKTGESLDKLAEAGKNNKAGLEQWVVIAKEANQVIGKESVEAFDRLAKKSEEADKRLAALFAPPWAATKSWIAESIERIRDDLDALSIHTDLIDKLAGILRMLSFGNAPGSSQAFRIGEFEAAVKSAEATLERSREAARWALQGTNDPRLNMPDYGSETIRQQMKAVEDARIALAQERDRFAKGGYGLPSTPPVTVNGDRIGGGRTDDDMLEAQIRRYDALKRAADNAQATIEKNREKNIDDLQREVVVQRQIDDIVGKLGAKYDQASDQQKKRFADAVSAAEQSRAAEQKLLETNIAADQTERRLGDGTRQYQFTLRELARQQATNRVSEEALARARKDAAEKLKDDREALARYKGGLEGFAAGIENAARAYEKANDAYSMGQKVFNGLTDAMSQGLESLAGVSNKTFDQIARDFAIMLERMALQAALSQVFKVVFGAMGFTIPTGGGQMYGPPAPALNSLDGGNRAIGGPVYPGNSYVVGEAGPERFVPTVAGQIVPMSRSTSSGDVTVNITMQGGSSSSPDANQTITFGQKVKAAVLDVIQREKQPGGSLYQRMAY